MTPSSATTTCSEATEATSDETVFSNKRETSSSRVGNDPNVAVAASYASERRAAAAAAHRASKKLLDEAVLRSTAESCFSKRATKCSLELGLSLVGETTSASGDVSSKAKHTVPSADAK